MVRSKILQQIRCYYLSEKNYKPISDSDLKYFDDLLPNDSFESRVYQVLENWLEKGE